jgi:hypothetical protein
LVGDEISDFGLQILKKNSLILGYLPAGRGEKSRREPKYLKMNIQPEV